MPLLSQAAILLDEISRIGSIRRAAEQMNASPSAVNRQILNLEYELGVSLFERYPKGVRLTAAGEAVVESVRRWRNDQQRLSAHLSELRGLKRGNVSLGLMEGLSNALGPLVIGQLCRQYPQLSVDVFVGVAEAVTQRLLSGNLNVAAAYNMPFRPELKIIYSAVVPIGVIVSPSHRLAKTKNVRINDCLAYPMIVPDRSFYLRGLLDAEMARSGSRTAPAVSANSIAFIITTLKSSERTSFLSLMDVYSEVAKGALVFIPVRDKGLERTLAIAVPVRTRNSSLALAVADALRVEVESLVQAMKELVV